MWLFTKYGFYSAVCARQGDGGYQQPVDRDRVMIRARVREHLEALRDRFPAWLGASPIHSSVDTDYAFRLFVDKAIWSQIVSELATEMDYDNFKSAVGQHQGKAGHAYQHSLYQVWSAMNALQSR